MKTLFLIAVSLQVVVILIDEFYFHWKRNLPTWERWGHPLDTLSILLPLSILCYAPHTDSWQIAYISLSAFSCVLITKDEWVHRELSPAPEQWLHANLFVLHPVVLIAAFFLWDDPSSGILLRMGFFGILSFLTYQLLFWNVYANRFFEKRL